MERAMSSGWACTKCGTQRIRTIVMDPLPAKGRGRAGSVKSKCPACDHVEVVTAQPGERIISIQYSSS
jgi:predicted RNA-binding Zn-ribbon protein involved in translation (DUF1610 family)